MNSNFFVNIICLYHPTSSPAPPNSWPPYPIPVIPPSPPQPIPLSHLYPSPRNHTIPPHLEQYLLSSIYSYRHLIPNRPNLQPSHPAHLPPLSNPVPHLPPLKPFTLPLLPPLFTLLPQPPLNSTHSYPPLPPILLFHPLQTFLNLYFFKFKHQEPIW